MAATGWYSSTIAPGDWWRRMSLSICGSRVIDSSPPLLEDLLCNAGRTVRPEGDDVLIGHAYVERRVRPLNLLFRECDEATAIAAACDYAQSIKDLPLRIFLPAICSLKISD
jgi:isocitrate dehydrogenase kinase/phosphatase